MRLIASWFVGARCYFSASLSANHWSEFNFLEEQVENMGLSKFSVSCIALHYTSFGKGQGWGKKRKFDITRVTVLAYWSIISSKYLE